MPSVEDASSWGIMASPAVEEENDDISSTPIMCSILNLIFDFSMEDPTPLEPQEYQVWKQQQQGGETSSKRSTLKVPVIRLYGPLLRDPRRGPLQSSCLHIHGAFPYMLARPVIAGPDGSLRRILPVEGQVNWDDPISVEQITKPLHVILETAIQALDLERSMFKDSDKGSTASRSFECPPLIRKISVVQGRGFYTYCPGPPAPFLKVEYYDPKLRWKVKLMLERGLQVPLAYHPDPLQYDREDTDGDNPDTLKFNCYEAHIPYSMQFFKDWNLAGMSYLQIQQGKIRPSLRDSIFIKYRAEPFDEKRDSSAVFLHFNTPPQYLWGGAGDENYYHDPEFPPPRKVTSSDIEIDCTVYDLRNIDSVLKTLPSAEEERDKIQWRAVPNLKEIWSQERRRMSRLLSPENDFLSQRPTANTEKSPKKDTPLFTLNVKQGAERSGTKLACNGMKSLVRLTHGLDNEFERALKEILQRHQEVIEGIDRDILNPVKRAKFAAVQSEGHNASSAMPLTPDVGEAIDALSSLAAVKTPNTPTLGDAVDALESLYHCKIDSPAVGSAIDTSQRDGREGHNVNQDHSRPFICSTQESQSSVLLSYPSSQNLHKDDAINAPSNPESFSQRVDRGESVFQDSVINGDNLEDCIDPETLQPYEHLDFGIDRCRVQFTVDSDPVGTVRICRKPRATCRREGHTEKSDKERAVPGYYKTISTGIFVDGVFEPIDTVYNEEEDSSSFEKALDVMRAAIPKTQAEAEDDASAECLITGGVVTRRYSQFTQSLRPTTFDDIRSSAPATSRDDDSHESDSDSETQVSTKLSKQTGSGSTSTSQQSPTKFSKPTAGSTRICEPKPTDSKDLPSYFPAWVSPSTSNPSRQLVSTTTAGSLHNMSYTTLAAPVWLKHVSRYIKRPDPALASDCHRNSYLQPSQLPPTRRKMRAWSRKLILPSGGQKKVQTLGAEAKVAPPILEIDSNSRKIVAFGDASKGDQVEVANAPNQIEEAVWEASQSWQLSMTQQYLGEDSNDHQTEKNDDNERNVGDKSQLVESISGSNTQSNSQSNSLSALGDPLEGIGAQGGKIHVQGGGTLKARTKATQRTPTTNEDRKPASRASVVVDSATAPISFMSVEIHVQCRTGISRLDSKRISMVADSNKDKIFAIVYVYGIDPGGGESLQILERCCLFVKFQQEDSERSVLAKSIEASTPRSNLGMTAKLHVECLESEKKLLLRFSSLVKTKDPDMLLSWDPQSAGLGYMIERGLVLNNVDGSANQQGPHPSSASTNKKGTIDLIRLLGRTRLATPLPLREEQDPKSLIGFNEEGKDKKFTGSGLGVDWDEKVGAGAAAASITGRLVFAGWKIVAEEVKHPNYSYLPAVVAAVLNKRLPCHDDLVLTHWYSSKSERWRVLHHRLNQAMATVLLFDALDIIGRAGEAARLSGVEFSQSFPGIRGSQYKVEGVLLRALQSLRSDERGSKTGKKLFTKSAHSDSSQECRSQTQSLWKVRRGITNMELNGEDRHYFFYSPSKEDSDRQEALEVQALTLEPESGHYTDPVIVCDFTALYPSLVIAYNLCYSTCAGKLEYQSTRGEMRIQGRTTGRLGPFTYPERRSATVLHHHFKSISKNESGIDRGYIAPTGTLYLGEDSLKGVLPQVLDEILTTRAMLKRAAKEYKKNVKDLSPAVLRQLEARQLALKYVANVSYGYTSATFSGRCAMPLLADTIVECGRKTLRKAINMANQWGQGDKWKGARVIYGDTDSLFVRLPGRSCQEAFDFGEELCQAVTADNPPPVQLKLEKVYVNSIMQTMKRYGGMKLESRNERKPTFEAKGLETVRRDQCALTQKILRNALITLFRSGPEGVRDYLHRQWFLINAGQIPVADFILTGRVRSQYRGGREGPVQAVLAQRLAEADPGNIIRHKERIPYVIVATPGRNFKLKDCVLTPLEMLERWDGYTIHSAYYIERHVNAALARCLSLAPHNIDVHAWYKACPKPRRRFQFWPVRSKSRATIDMHFGSDRCALCDQKCKANGRAKVVVCPTCRGNRLKSAQTALSNLNEVQRASMEVAKECSRCNGCFEDSETFAGLIDARRSIGTSLVNGTVGDEHLRIPLANCVCIDCPNTFKRHHLREQLLQSTATCEVLELF